MNSAPETKNILFDSGAICQNFFTAPNRLEWKIPAVFGPPPPPLNVINHIKFSVSR